MIMEKIGRKKSQSGVKSASQSRQLTPPELHSTKSSLLQLDMFSKDSNNNNINMMQNDIETMEDGRQEDGKQFKQFSQDKLLHSSQFMSSNSREDNPRDKDQALYQQQQERKRDFDKHQAVVFKEKHNLESSHDVRFTSQNRKVLIICTGGTISMFPSENGLTVRSGFFEKFLREDSYFCDSDYTFFHSKDDFLITPLTIYQQRIWYKILELEKPIDSTNMNVEYYDQIATIIETNYEQYDGFIILHGTDTMAYTASALSFMLENLSKTVIITGSQIPCSSMRNDGFNNLLCSLTVAGHYTIPEVLICFNNKLLRGNRSTKMDSSAMDSFDSPNFEPLATFKMTIKIKWDKVLKRDPLQKFKVQKNLCDKIAIVKMHPFISSDTLKAILTNEDTKAIIIETYGAGNIPTNRPELMQILGKAHEQGKVIVNLSQCYKSNVISIYETGRALLKVGVVCGWDCTTEAMASKLSYLFSKNYTVENIRKLVQKNLRGEISPPIENDMFEFQQENFIQALNDALQYRTNEKIDILKNLILPNIVCYMSKGGFHQSMTQLKSYGIDFDKGDYDNRTGLHLAAREGQLETVKFLIKECKDINIVDKFGRTPLFEAVLNRQKDVVIELHRAGGKIEAPQLQITSILMDAIKQGDQEMLQLFQIAGLSDWNQYVTIDGRNLGHVAASFRQTEIIRFLKHQCKFKFTDKDRWGKTALDEAKKRDFKEICKLLS